MTTSLKHNKKRNVGLVYELLSRCLASAIIKGDDALIKKAKTIAMKHFNKSTDLYKELKVFRALSETRLKNKEGARTLLEKAKHFTSTQSQSRIDLEKTALIQEINACFGPAFFNTTFEDYKIFASIQVLMNEWRSKDLFESIEVTSLLEEQVLEQLVREPDPNPIDLEEVAASDANGLLLKIMAEKINNKFKGLLNEQQIHLVQLYGLGNKQELKDRLTELKGKLSKTINEAIASSEYDEELKVKLKKTKVLLEEKYSDTSTPDLEKVSWYLSMSKLEQELRS